VTVSPLNNPHSTDVYRNVLMKKVNYSKKFSTEAKSFCQGLLIRAPEKRLGSKGIHQIKKHPFLKGIDWELVAKKKLKPPFVPKLDGPLDLRNISANYVKEDVSREQEEDPLSYDQKRERHMSEFTYMQDERSAMSRCGTTDLKPSTWN